MSTTTVEGLLIRPSTMDDVAQVAELLNACGMAEYGAPMTTVEELEREWATPGFNPETDAWVVVTPENRTVGYVEVFDALDPPVRVYSWGRVHPDYCGQGIGTHLLELSEVRAREAIAKAPPHARVSLGQGINSNNAAAKALFEGRGYQLVRRFWRMVIDLDQPPPAPEWPTGITLRTLQSGEDIYPVYQAVEETFQDHWGHVPLSFDLFKHFMAENPDFDPTLWFLAMDGDEIAGFSLCTPKLTEDPDMGWVNELGVRRPWRRRGIALALLQHSFAEMHRRGKPRAGLGVDSQNLTGATRLYEKAGMHVARQYDRYEKELRPGEELSTQSLS